MQQQPKIATLLHSQRIVLRAVTRADQQKVFEGLSNPEIIKYFGISYKTFEDTAKQIDWYEKSQSEQTGQAWAIILNDLFVGIIGMYNLNWQHLNAEIGYWVFPQYWKQGITSEAMQTVLIHARNDLKLHRVFADVEPENIASLALLKKCGFAHEGTKRECERKEGVYINLETWSILFPEN